MSDTPLGELLSVIGRLQATNEELVVRIEAVNLLLIKHGVYSGADFGAMLSELKDRRAEDKKKVAASSESEALRLALERLKGPTQ